MGRHRKLDIPNKRKGQEERISDVSFQKMWHIVGDATIEATLSFLSSGNLLKELNRTLLVLIPKQKGPTLPSQFRPISLCNVAYKVCSKVLVNWLRPIFE